MMITFGSSVSILTTASGSVFRTGAACASDRPELLWQTRWVTGCGVHSILGGIIFARTGAGSEGFWRRGRTYDTHSIATQAAAATADHVHHKVRRFFNAISLNTRWRTAANAAGGVVSSRRE